MKKSSMPKIVLATSLAALLTACGGSSGSGDTIKSNTGTGVEEGLSSTGGQIDSNATVTDNSGNSGADTTDNTQSNQQQVQNADSNSTQAVDTTSPKITLKGEKVITIAKGSTYIEQGAKAIDNKDGDLNVNISGDVDTNSLGSYTITYIATDSAGNETKIERTVHVTPPNDSDSPTIFLKGSNPLTIAHGSTFDDPGATATDPQEGDLSSDIRAESNINTQKVGAYSVDYSVTDSAGNKTTVRRVVKVTDQEAPVITINGDKTITKYMEPNGDRIYVDAGATATDNVDEEIEVKKDMGNLNLNKPGTYTITYTATDKAGNKATAKRTVNVVDNGKPTITLKGDNPTKVAHLGTYTELGATATDEVDGSDLKVKVSGKVNTSRVGSYQIVYSVTDKAGNTQTTKRIVKVTDQAKPTIKLNGEQIVTVTQGNDYIDQGAIATDLVDGNVKVSTTENVDTSKIGTYTVKYSAKDNAGNEATAERKVYVVLAPDIEKPVISLVGDNPMIVSQGSTFIDPKAGVSDNRDITIPLTIDGSVDSSKVGEYTLTYKAQDRAGNIATVTRVVKVVDDGKPTITLNGKSQIDIDEGDTYTDAGAVARDNVDQTVKVITTGSVDSSKPGTYTLTYNAEDKTGNKARPISRTVIVHDITKPIISLIGDSTVVVKQGGKYIEKGASVTDNVDKNLQPAISGKVDTTKLGTYTITYSATDSAGNSANMVTRTVYVVDNEAPVIKVAGDNPLIVAQGSKFTDPGATATDNKDGKIKVTSSGTVNTDKLGTYTITYTADKDSAGNEAKPQTRTVIVKDLSAPVLTLNKFGAEDKTVHIIKGNSFEDPSVTVTDNVDKNLKPTIAGKVNTTKLGTYTIKYSVTDSAGNSASTSRTVIVIKTPESDPNPSDKIKPEITLNGGNMTITLGETFVDPGAKATDNIDINVPVVVEGKVDTSKVGVYTITYKAQDRAQNIATITRTVTVTDGAGNTIAINGNNPMIVAHQSDFVDPGYSTTDISGQDMNVTVEGSVDTSEVGDYTLTYNATDSAGNKLSATRVVKVTDQTKPVIKLNGSNPINIKRGEEFTDPEAIVTDNWDDTITISGAGDVDTSTLGKYTLTYDVTDSAGNKADTVTRDVYVLDATKPTISLYGKNPMIVDYMGSYNEPGATAQDNRDGYIDIKNIDSSNVDTSKVGDYDVIYTAEDSVGNVATVKRKVLVRDRIKPKITLNGDEKIMHIIKGNGFIDPKATASDNHDGDITDKIVIDSNVNTSKVGEYRVIYSVKDQAGNKSEAVRSVIVVNPPYDGQNNGITASIYPNIQHMPLKQGDKFKDPGAKIVTHNVNEKLTVKADTSSVDASKVGTYNVKYEAVDMLGNVRATAYMSVSVDDKTAPVLHYDGKNIITSLLHEPFIMPDVTATDNNDANIDVDVVGAVDTTKVGTYTLKYSATDKAGNRSNTKTITVYVVKPADISAPVISLNGEKVVHLKEGEKYIEKGAKAVDETDGEVEVKITGEVFSAPGTYQIHYSAQDIAENRSEAIRTVIVDDTTPPTLDIGAKKSITLTIGDTFIDPGYSAKDNVDINVKVDVDSNVDTSKEGTYRVIYTATDSAGNKTTDIRRVIVTNPLHGDNGVYRPSVKINGNHYVDIPFGGVYEELGAKATDSFGVPLDVNIDGEVDTNRVGYYQIYYTATDSYGNWAYSDWRAVYVYDDIAPKITLNGDNPLFVTVGDKLVDPGATAIDNADGDISQNIKVTPRVNTNKAGTYTITYSVEDNSGNYDEITRDVYVVLPPDTQAPKITLNGSKNITINDTDTYQEPGATAVDDRDGEVRVIPYGNVKSTPGTYTIWYEATDLAGHTGYATRTVTVKDTTPPTIRLYGYHTEVVIINHPYNDRGAYAYDNSWWNRKYVYAKGYVDTSKAGTYTLSYSIKDNAGNESKTITRTVVVKDPTK